VARKFRGSRLTAVLRRIDWALGHAELHQSQPYLVNVTGVEVAMERQRQGLATKADFQ